MSSTDAPVIHAWGLNLINSIDIAVCSLSCAGALLMIGTCLWLRLLQRARHRLIFALAVTDLVLALSVLVPGIYDLIRSTTIPANSAGCNAGAFFYATSVLSVNLWALAIAIITFIILVRPLSHAARVIETRRFFLVLALTIYLPCISVATAGIVRYRTVDLGGLCFFSARDGLFSILVLFVPRSAILLVVILLYLRLFIFFKRKTTFRVALQQNDTPESSEANQEKRASLNPLSWSYGKLRKASKDSESTTVWSDLANVELDINPAAVDVRRASDASSAIELPERPTNKGGIDWHTTVRWNDSIEPAVDSSISPQTPRPSRLLDGSGASTPREGRRGSLPMAPSPLRPLPEIRTDLAPIRSDEPQASFYDMLKEGPPPPPDPRSPVPKPPKPTLDPEEMNRRAAMLMLLYPAAYIILFSVAVARAIMDLANPQGRGVTQGSIALHAISRWLIFASGFVDAIIFVVIERVYHHGTKARARRRSEGTIVV